MQNVAQSTVGTIERVTPGDLSSLTGALPDVEHPTNCPGCGIALRHEELRRGAYVCSCGHHLPMHADAWIALLADEGTWTERWSALRSRDPLGWTSPRPYARQLEEAERRGLNESVRTGQCRLEDRAIWLAVFDFRVVGGTLGVVAGERLARAGASAARSCTPFVLVTASGGARMQEGVFALMQMAKVNEAVAAMDAARAPFFSVLSSPTYGGTAASLALLADVNLAEPGAALGFTGRRVIRQAGHADLPNDFQTAEFQLDHGQVDMIVPRTELRAKLVRLCDLFA